MEQVIMVERKLPARYLERHTRRDIQQLGESREEDAKKFMLLNDKRAETTHLRAIPAGVSTV